jgi:hypothetical protein
MSLWEAAAAAVLAVLTAAWLRWRQVASSIPFTSYLLERMRRAARTAQVTACSAHLDRLRPALGASPLLPQQITATHVAKWLQRSCNLPVPPPAPRLSLAPLSSTGHVGSMWRLSLAWPADAPAALPRSLVVKCTGTATAARMQSFLMRHAREPLLFRNGFAERLGRVAPEVSCRRCRSPVAAPKAALAPRIGAT